MDSLPAPHSGFVNWARSPSQAFKEKIQEMRKCMYDVQREYICYLLTGCKSVSDGGCSLGNVRVLPTALSSWDRRPCKDARVRNVLFQNRRHGRSRRPALQLSIPRRQVFACSLHCHSCLWRGKGPASQWKSPVHKGESASRNKDNSLSLTVSKNK